MLDVELFEVEFVVVCGVEEPVDGVVVKGFPVTPQS